MAALEFCLALLLLGLGLAKVLLISCSWVFFFLLILAGQSTKSITLIRLYAAPTLENSVQLFSFLDLLEVGGGGGLAACGFGVGRGGVFSANFLFWEGVTGGAILDFWVVVVVVGFFFLVGVPKVGVGGSWVLWVAGGRAVRRSLSSAVEGCTRGWLRGCADCSAWL